jgi:hypothetical protein
MWTALYLVVVQAYASELENRCPTASENHEGKLWPRSCTWSAKFLSGEIAGSKPGLDYDVSP